MNISRSFFSLYFFVIAIFVIASWVLDEAWNSYIEQDVESYTGYQMMLRAVGDYMVQHPEENWSKVADGVSEKYQVPLSLISSEQLANKDELANQLKDNDIHIYYDDEKVMLYYWIANTNSILEFGPAKLPSRPNLKAYVRAILLLALGALLFIWIWPMSRDLNNLKYSTNQLADGNFETRVSEAKSSMVKPMVNTFNMMASKVKQLLEAHKELTNAVAHELRTPLARSKFALQILEGVEDPEKRAKYQQQIKGDIAELEELINEMLLYSSMENTQPEMLIESTNIEDIVQSQIAQYQHYHGDIELVTKEDNIFAACDGHFIDRAMNNYIANAVKYGRDKIRITIEKDEEFCTLTVEDNGEGVSDEFKAVVFDAFSRGDESRNRETGGFGLGLAIVSRIMHWHHGTAGLKDSELGGAAFYLKWPLKVEE